MPVTPVGALDNKERRRLYDRWKCMVHRCYYPSHVSYERYGGRGITVCEAWKDSFQAFLDWALTSGYEPGLFLEREDNDGAYCPENCRWATSMEQGANKSNNVWVTAFGETKILAAWMRDTRIPVPMQTYWDRIGRGWTPERALTELPSAGGWDGDDPKVLTAFGETKTYVQWTKDPRCPGLTYSAINHRMLTGWEPEAAVTMPSGRRRPRLKVLL